MWGGYSSPKFRVGRSDHTIVEPKYIVYDYWSKKFHCFMFFPIRCNYYMYSNQPFTAVPSPTWLALSNKLMRL
jgi:hypothetical protein